jgi:hypothetical protein
MHRLSRVVIGVMVMGAAAALAAAATPAFAAHTAVAPPGYHRVLSAPIPAPPGNLDSGGQVACPTGTVVWGGGVGFTGGIAGPGDTINTSAPTASGWKARYNNSSNRAANFRIDAICAKKPQGYTMTFTTVDNPAGTQSSATAACPAHTVLLSGGTSSTADSVNAALTSAFPAGSHKFTAVMSNGTGTDQRVTAYAICGKKPARYTIVSAPSSDTSGRDTLVSGAECPARTRILGGGIKVASPRPSATLGASLDDPGTQWLSEVNNTTPGSVQVTVSAICAA